MSKNLIIGIVLAIAIVGGGVAYVLTRPDDTPKDNGGVATDGENDQKPAQTQASTESGSIKEFLAAGENKECTYSTAESNGTMYFASGERMRMDYKGTGADAEASSGSMIIQSKSQYVWGNESKEGIKFAFDKDAAPTDDETNSSTNLEQDYSFTCKSWNVDESKFTPPSDVTFRDFSALTNQP